MHATLTTAVLAAVPAVSQHSDDAAFIQNPAGILATLLAILAIIFWLSQHKTTQPFFKVIPALVFCYFIPTTLTTCGILPAESAFYGWVKAYILPTALFLLVLSLDLPAILRLGPKAGIMLLAGTAGVVIGGPIALFLSNHFLPAEYWGLPADAWKGMAALSGSWIGGGANFVAIGDSVGCSSAQLATMVIPDVLVANVWMGVLLFFAGRQHKIDRWTGANASAIRQLEQRLTEFQTRVMRVPNLTELMIILALGFGASWISFKGADLIASWSSDEVRAVAEHAGLEQVAIDTKAGRLALPPADPRVKPAQIGPAIEKHIVKCPDALGWMTSGERRSYALARFVNEKTGGGMWKYVFVTTLGLILSFTRVRNLEGAGASKIGSVMLYLLVACIGASADFKQIAEAPGYVIAGAIWMVVHISVLLTVAWLIKAPIFFVAVGSQANIGGAASAPIVAAAYHPSLAPVGVLLAVAGYVLGTYAGLLCATMLKIVAQG